jgi:AraC-like DNA-binding protein
LRTVHENLQISLLHVERTPYETLWGVFQRPQWAISHVRRGDVGIRVAGLEFRAPAGSVMVHPPGIEYSESGTQPGFHDWLVVEALVGSNVDLLRLHPVSPVVILHDEAAYSRIFEQLLAAWNRDDGAFRNLRCASLAAALLMHLLESWTLQGAAPRPGELSSPQDRFSSLVQWMSANLEKKLSREDLARHLHLHPNYLDRAFRSTYGQTPLQVLRDLRLQRALQMLENTDETLDTIATRCGFEEAAYFCRSFRSRFGVSPGKHRQSVKSAKQGYSAL